jgi:HK97 family phage major capsid protein
MLLEQLRGQLAELLNRRTIADDALNALENGVAERGESNLTPEETTRHAELRAQLAEIDAARPALEANIRDLEGRAAARAAADTLARSIPTPAIVGGGRLDGIRNEARTYRPDAEHSFFVDLYARSVRQESPDQAERLARHMQEFAVERRDISVSALAGMVPPQYLVDEFAPIARAGRPFLNSLNGGRLGPDGISFTVPRGTTGTAAAMTAEGAAWNEQDMANTDLVSTANLVTAQQDLSRTLFMRGGAMVDQFIFPDLLESLALAGNVSAWNGNGTAPQHRGVLQVAGINSVAYTDASPTVPELWPKMADAVQRVNSLRYAPATVFYMHPRRWGWITAAVDSTGRPLFDFTKTPPNVVIGLGKAAEYGQIVGTLMGLPVITDASIPTNLGAGTNEDVIVAAKATDIRFFETDVITFTFEQTVGPEKVRLAAGQFQLFIPGRYPTAISTIGGTGLVTPAF